MKIGLVLVDIQNDYFKGGKYELVHPEQAAMQANKVLTFFRKQNLPIFHVRHISTNPGASFFLPDTVGAEFYKDCWPIEGEEIIIKHRPDSFLNTNLKEKLEEKGIDTLVMGGMMTHMCIDTTVRAASAHGYAVELIEDACATRDLEWAGNKILADQVQNAYMAALSGTFAKVSKSDEWIEAHA
jgi:nicotinamidase-related amidase